MQITREMLATAAFPLVGFLLARIGLSFVIKRKGLLNVLSLQVAGLFCGIADLMRAPGHEYMIVVAALLYAFLLRGVAASKKGALWVLLILAAAQVIDKAMKIGQLKYYVAPGIPSVLAAAWACILVGTLVYMRSYAATANAN